MFLFRKQYKLDEFDQILSKSDEDFKLLLQNEKGLVTLTAENQKTLLHHLVRNFHVRFTNKLNILIQLGADLSAEDDLSRTAIDIAAQYGHSNCIKILLPELIKQKYDFNRKFSNGNNFLLVCLTSQVSSRPVYFAELKVQQNIGNGIVPFILEKLKDKLDIDGKNTHNINPLFLAVYEQQFDAAIALIKAGADPEIICSYGSSPNKKQINAISLMDIHLSLRSSESHMTNQLLIIKERIVLERFFYLINKSVTEYKKNSGTQNQKELDLINNIDDSIQTIEKILEDCSSMENTQQAKQKIANLLQECKAYVEESRKNSNKSLLSYFVSYLNLGECLNKLTTHSLLQYLDISTKQENLIDFQP